MRLFEGTEFDIPPRCDRCNELEEDCECGPPPPERKAAAEQTAKISLEKRAKGKRATVITGLQEPDTDMKQLLTQLKNSCGSGGTLKGDTIELQGNQLDAAKRLLQEIGYRVR